MTRPKPITILPELESWLDPLEPDELAGLKADIARDSLTDPICWARLEHDAATVNAILDGHHRFAICKEINPGMLNRASAWRLIEGVTTVAEAKEWMLARQSHRRNWTPNQKAMRVADLYEDAKLERGARTDVYGGAPVDTAKAIGERFQMSDRAVSECAKFARAVGKITETCGIEARAALLSKTPPVNRDTAIELAAAPADLQREAWQQLLKRDVTGAKAILAKAKRGEQKKRPGSAPGPGPSTSAAERYDFADLVRLLATNWGPERLESYDPSYPQQVALEVHAGDALRTLIWLAEHRGWGETALDEYRAEVGGVQDGEEDDLADEDTVAEPAAADEPPKADYGDRTLTCRECGATFARAMRGRPPSRCPDCKGQRRSA